MSKPDARPFRCPEPEGGCGKLLHAPPDTPVRCPSCRRWWEVGADGARRESESPRKKRDGEPDDEGDDPDETPAPDPEIEPEPKPEKRVSKSDPESMAAWCADVEAATPPITSTLRRVWGMTDQGARLRLKRMVAAGLLTRERERNGKVTRDMYYVKPGKPTAIAQAARKAATEPVPAEAPAVVTESFDRRNIDTERKRAWRAKVRGEASVGGRSPFAQEVAVLEALCEISASADGVAEAIANLLALTPESRSEVCAQLGVKTDTTVPA